MAFFALILLLLSSAYLIWDSEPSTILKRVQKKFLELEIRQNEIYSKNIYEIVGEFKSDLESEAGISRDKLKRDIAVQCFIKDSLVFWTDNSVPEIEIGKIGRKPFVLKLANGWYEIRARKDRDTLLASLLLLKSEYSVENDYLSNSLTGSLKLPKGVDIVLPGNANVIDSEDGTPMFSLDFSHYEPCFDRYSYPILLLLLLIFAGLILGLYHSCSAIPILNRNNLTFLLLLISGAIFLRLFQAYTEIPYQLIKSKLFSSSLYSSSGLLPSLGDYILNSFILLMLSVLAWKKTQSEDSFGEIKKQPKSWLIAGMIIFYAGFYILLCLALKDLVVNSSFSLDLRDLSTIGINSVLGLLIIGALSLSFIITTLTALRYLNLTGSRERWILIVAGTVGVFMILNRDWDLPMSVFLALLLGGYILLQTRTKDPQKIKIKPATLFTQIFILAIVCTAVLNETINKREKEERRLIAIRLSAGKNPVTESLYGKLSKRITSDTSLISMLLQDNDSLATIGVMTLKSQFLVNYWKRFHAQVTVCSGGRMLKVQPKGEMFECDAYFDQLIKRFGENTPDSGLWYMDYGTGLETYLAQILPESGKNYLPSDRIYIEFNVKSLAKDPGYPELLLDQRVLSVPDLSNYSYALYQENNLVYKAGKLSYPLVFPWPNLRDKSEIYLDSEGANHFITKQGKSRMLVISRQDDSIASLISPVSYLLIFIFLLAFTVNLAAYPASLREISFMSLKSRFRSLTVGMVVVSFLILGGLLIYFMNRLNDQKNMDSFSERTYSVMNDLQEKFAMKEVPGPPSTSELEETVQRLSGLFYCDINVYGIDGKLIVSSRPEIFDEGLISKRMNFRAIDLMRINGQSLLFQEEKIGSYSYTSAYFPLFNDTQGNFAYINLPFFSKQEDLKREINDFFVAFMNLYIIFILISVLTSLAVSRYLSAPLAMLAGRMEAFKLGLKNEKIIWKQPDEIGKLVEEYNRLIDELAFSADQLAQSERESAWREMAKQVAHEIKNPLTPMKLSVQHLARAWSENPGDFDSKLKRFHRVMIEQIESLSSIATEFSDFAKMPVPVNEDIDLVMLLESLMGMYSGIENIQFSFQTELQEAMIKGDRKLLSRVFTNLINNSVQAISSEKKGHISISMDLSEEYYSIDFLDNGDGIPEEIAEKIFQPNFTTKSGGSGLGLAIVRGIIRSMGGDVIFVSETGSTLFTVLIPLNYDVEKRKVL